MEQARGALRKNGQNTGATARKTSVIERAKILECYKQERATAKARGTAKAIESKQADLW
jgi:hypothetical protein